MIKSYMLYKAWIGTYTYCTSKHHATAARSIFTLTHCVSTIALTQPAAPG